MPFCTSCRAEIDAAAQACPSCGKAVGGATAPPPAAATPAPAAAPAAAPAKSGGGTLKVILLVMGGLALLIVVFAVLGLGAAYYVAKRSHVEQGPEGAKVETPFGSVETTNQDSAKIAEKLGVEVYPGARPLPGGASVSVAGMHTASVMFESDDPPEKIEEFYRKQFPKATVTSQRGDSGTHIALMMGSHDKWTTITIEGQENGSKIVIASVNGGAQ
jgi:hypothetical protein